MPRQLLGCIADDFTGATDLANNLVRGGMRVVQTVGVPSEPLDESVDAIVIALKSRTSASQLAVEQSLLALSWLQAQGASQIYFKYCSTFDSTAAGNIGPVTEALMAALGTDFTIACPAFPENGRSVYMGHLFVGQQLLHESPMRDHPLTPMTDSNLVRVLQSQSQGLVGLIDHGTVSQGPGAVARRIAALRSGGVKIAIVDATSNSDLLQMGPVWAGMPLLTAGSGIALGLPANFGHAPQAGACLLPPAVGARAIVSGSCSQATNQQVAKFLEEGGDGFAVDPLRVARGDDVVSEALAWAGQCMGAAPILVYATASPLGVQAVQQQLGVQRAATLVEDALSAIALGLVRAGVGQLIVAGGETSGACVQALAIDRLRIGPQICPGVPWCHSPVGHGESRGLHIALKSGNFGGPAFFQEAFYLLAPAS